MTGVATPRVRIARSIAGCLIESYARAKSSWHTYKGCPQSVLGRAWEYRYKFRALKGLPKAGRSGDFCIAILAVA